MKKRKAHPQGKRKPNDITKVDKVAQKSDDLIKLNFLSELQGVVLFQGENQFMKR